MSRVTPLGTDAYFIIRRNMHLIKLSYRCEVEHPRHWSARSPMATLWLWRSRAANPQQSISPRVELEVGDRLVRISNPDRVYFPARGETKLDLANYYLSVGEGIVRALRERPCMMH